METSNSSDFKESLSAGDFQKTSVGSDSKKRILALRRLLEIGSVSSQEDLVEELKTQKFQVTQSTISRDLRRLGAVRTVDANGRTVYRLPEDVESPPMSNTDSLRDLVVKIEHNGALIVLHTQPGSASLVARHLDQVRPGGILGTIAGDDTIFVAPASIVTIEETMLVIMTELG